MADNQQKYYRDGTSQAQRLLAALQKEYVALDERTIGDWLRFAKEYAKELNYYNFNNQIEGDWSGFLAGDVDEMVAFLEDPKAFANQPNKQQWYSRPHFVLFIVFLKLLDQYHKAAFNNILQRHLDYYYRKILKFEQKPATPDQVFLIAELSKNYKGDRFLLEEGAEAFAGKDKTGKDLIYKTDEDLMVNRAQIAGIKTVFVDRKVERLETYDLSDGFMGMLKLALAVDGVDGEGEKDGEEDEGKAAPEGELAELNLVTTPGELNNHFFENQVLPFLQYTQKTLKISFDSLRKLMTIKRERDADLKKEQEPEKDWDKLNKLMTELKNGAEIKFEEKSEEEKRDFVTNFQIATGVHPLPEEEEVQAEDREIENVFKNLQNVKNIYDLYEEINFANSGNYYTYQPLGGMATALWEYHNLSRLESLRKFVNENFYASLATDPLIIWNRNLNHFQQMMELRYNIRKAWINIWEILASYPELKTAKIELEEPNYQTKFKDLLKTAYQTEIKDLDSYYEDLEKIEAYFNLQAEEIQFILEYVFKPEKERSEDKNARKRVNELLIKTHKAKLPDEAVKKAPRKVSLNGLYAYPDATALKTGAEDEEYPRWQTFGAAQPENLATLGLAIRSPILALCEGTRTITIDIFPDDEQIATQLKGKHDANAPFLKVQVSGEKEWLDVEAGQFLKLDTISNDAGDSENKQLFRVQFKLEPDFDPVMALPEDAEGYLGSLPAIRILLINPDWSINKENDTTAYDLFSRFTIEKIDLKVEVEKLLPSAIRNDHGELDAEEPFEVFGPRPKAGSRLCFTHPELIGKRLDSVTISGDWMGVPYVGLSTYYEAYKETETDTPPDFKATLRLLSPKTEIPPNEPDLELFNTGNSLFSTVNFEDVHKKIYKPLETFESSNNVFENDRYLVLKLGSTDFGHDRYPALAAQKASELAIDLARYNNGDLIKKNGDGADVNTPPETEKYKINPPYTPQLQNFSITYTASAKGPGSNKSDNRAEIIHLHPFGYELLDSGYNHTFLPKYPQEGYLYIGLKDLNPPFDLPLLFQLAEGSADPDLKPEPVVWHYLSGDRWLLPGLHGNPVSDSTHGLRNSGIVKIRIPAKADTAHHILPSGLHWLRASVRENSAGLSHAVGIHAQAVSATFENRANDPNHLKQPLLAESIKKLRKAQPEIKSLLQPYSSFGGAPVEALERVHTRASERLRHKNRALTVWDYEHLVLEAFPQVFKVKSIMGAPEDEVGKVTMVMVPNLKGIRPFDPFKPKLPHHLLGEIDDYLRKRAAPGAEISVQNPVYIQLRIRVSVELYPQYQSNGRYYLDLLNRALQEYLAPWAFDQGTDIPIGGKIYPSKIVHFVERLKYVDYVQDFRIIFGEEGAMHPADKYELQNGLPPTRPDAVWVSARKHLLSTTGTSGVGVGYMIVENDFQIG